jgi:cytidine deaminase
MAKRGAPRKSDLDRLAEFARAVRKNAYAPYSRFKVGAAVLAGSGRVYAGANVENASYGLSICAERSAVAQAVAAGEKEIIAVAVATSGRTPGPPCGMCRQVLSEFGAPSMPVRLVAERGGGTTVTLGKLLPLPFGKRFL